ncbi:MAG: MFS transporter [Dehalococcoidia bacterium]|nr:MFS transporter [Dehalococcoidia bacterium]
MRTFESLGNRDFRYLWLGQLATSMGQWMDQVTRAWLIYSMTGSALQLGLVSAARGVPLLIFGTIAGAVADRYGRKAQLIIAQSTNTVLNVILAVLVVTGKVQPWHVYVTGFLAGTVQAFQQPARMVMINDLVGRDKLLNAVSLNSAAVNVSRSVGPALSGVLIVFLGVGESYFLQAGLFALATIWVIQIRVPDAVRLTYGRVVTVEQTLLGSTKEGLAYIASNRTMLALMVLGLAPMTLGMPFVSLMPVFALDVFHGNATTQGLLLTTFGIGAVAGALAIASAGNRLTMNGKLLLFAAAGFGLSLVFFSRSPVLILAGAFTLLAGVFNGSYTSQNQTMIQMLAPSKLRGRLLGIFMLNRGLTPVGSLLAGVLATYFGGPWAVTLMGGSCFLLVVGVAIFAPEVWRLRIVPDVG